MPYRMNASGLKEVNELLGKLEKDAQKVAARALYEGAGIMADEMKRSAEQIRTEPFRYVKNGTRLPSPEEKAILLAAGTGIAKFDKDGTDVNTSVGYRSSGYADLNGKTKPIPQIANSINSGTSFMQKQPFVRKAASSGGKKAAAAMKASIEGAFDEITK